MKVYTKAASSALLVGSLLTSVCCGAQGQAKTAPFQDVTVHLTLKQAEFFPEALKSLAAQGHVVFVAEDTPLHPVLADAAAPDVKHDMSLSATVDKIAAAYDYTASRQGNVFVLEKNYTSPDDLPSVSPAECALALKDVALVMAGFDSHTPRHFAGQDDPLVADLIHSLTAEQAQAMQTSALSVAALAPAQQAFVHRIALHFYIEDPLKDNIKPSIISLEKMPTYAFGVADWHFSKERVFPHLFGYRTSDVSDPRAFSPFDDVAVRSDGIVLNQTVDVSDPLRAVQTPAVQTPVDDGHTTLEKAVAGLAADGKKPVLVDAALRDKPVTLVGAENASPDEVRSALTDLYGLRIRTDEKGARFLTRPAFRVPLEVEGVPLEVRRLLPPSLLRKVHDSAYQQSRTPWEQLAATNGADIVQDEQDFKKKVKQAKEAAGISDAIKKAAIKRIYAAIAPQLKAAPGQFIPFAKLPESAREAFALYQMADMLGEVLNALTPRVPLYLTQPDSIVLTGGPYTDPQGKAKFSLTLKYVSPGGQTLTVASVFNMDVSSNGGG